MGWKFQKAGANVGFAGGVANSRPRTNHQFWPHANAYPTAELTGYLTAIIIAKTGSRVLAQCRHSISATYPMIFIKG